MIRRLVVHRTQVIEIDDQNEPDLADWLARVHNSLLDTILDEQDSICETSDDHFEYVPREIVELRVELQQ